MQQRYYKSLLDNTIDQIVEDNRRKRREELKKTKKEEEGEGQLHAEINTSILAYGTMAGT